MRAILRRTPRFVHPTAAKDGELADVSAAAVALLENGLARDITSFKPDRRPVSAAILVDRSAAVGSSYRLHFVDAVLGFLKRLPEGARYALWTTGDWPMKLVDHPSHEPTDRRPRLEIAFGVNAERWLVATVHDLLI